jgi:hypothetical protein
MDRLEPLVGDEGTGELVDVRLEERLAAEHVARHIAVLLVGMIQKLPQLGDGAVREPFFILWNRSRHDGDSQRTWRTVTAQQALHE